MSGRPPHISDDRILIAARDVFLSEGMATTTAKIAERAGVSEGFLFYRYKTKEALLLAVIERETRVAPELAALPSRAGSGTVAGNLDTAVRALVRNLVTGRPFILLAESFFPPALLREHLFASRKEIPPERDMRLIAEYLEAEARAGRVRPVRMDLVARAIFGACIVTERAELAARDTGPQDIVRDLVDILLLGISAPEIRE